jgi:hypothetical protein
MPIWTPAEVEKEAKRLTGRGIEAAARLFANLVRQTLSIPAPPARYKTSRVGRRGRIIQPRRAATPATPGAPPRRVTGRLRGSIAVEFNPVTNSARVGTNVVYGRRLELGDHKYLLPTLQANLAALTQVAGMVIEGTVGYG